MITILLLVAVVTLLYYFAVKPYSYWSNKNVKTGKVIPIFGDNLYLMLGKEGAAHMFKRIYNVEKNASYIGFYQMHVPMLLIKSPELIKKICVKDFDHFLNRRSFIPEDSDDIFGRNLFALKGLTWKNMRTTISPTFTSSKMKAMFQLICENAEIFVEHFLRQNEKLIEVDVKDIFSRYSVDVIASSAFGIRINSLEDRNNDFYVLGREAGSFGSKFRDRMKFILFQSIPKVATFLKVKLFDQKLEDFFVNITKETIKQRLEKNIKRPDMLGLLLESREKGFKEENVENDITETNFAAVQEHLEMRNNDHQLTDRDIVSQLFLFFFAGFEAVSTSMSFLAHELAVNPDIQKKLIDEIDENRTGNETPSYETIAKMTYLDMIITETLRKYPIAVGADRVVTKPYTIEPEFPHEKTLNLDVGDCVMLPIIGIHYDPEIYENPEKFDPERFSPANRNNINPYTYLPFGTGPRNCIGSRYALLKIKAVFFYLLSEFEIVPVEKTQVPLKISKKHFNLFAEKDCFHLGLKRRN